jgi:hypothetical protein
MNTIELAERKSRSWALMLYVWAWWCCSPKSPA